MHPRLERQNAAQAAVEGHECDEGRRYQRNVVVGSEPECKQSDWNGLYHG